MGGITDALSRPPSFLFLILLLFLKYLSIRPLPIKKNESMSKSMKSSKSEVIEVVEEPR